MFRGDIINTVNYDCISKKGIEQLLINKEIKLTVLDEVDSTNLYLKRNADSSEDGEIIIAKSQTAGRGRFTRKFHSPQNSGIYMSIFLKPSLAASESILITTAAAVAVSEACDCLSGKHSYIKWVNDVLIDSKKVCGILTEGSINAENGLFNYAILGIGVNVYEPAGGFDSEIKDIAGFVFDEQKENLSNRLAAKIINRFYEYYNNLTDKSFLKSYRERSNIIGKEINVIRADTVRAAKAIAIDDECRLLVEYEDKSKEYLSSGEVSVRPL